MCGIAGIVGVPARRGAAPDALVRSMMRAISHRGPDGSAVWLEPGIALGHARLSIIDLSPAAAQPMHDHTGRYVLVYNGEVYNYQELRRELEGKGHGFRTASDSEVVLHSYIEWGAACLDRFNGMWAFAVWDRERSILFAARDRAGKKPFYYALDDAGAFYFASEVKALRSAGFRFGLDAQAAFDFLTQGTYGHLGDRSFLTGVRQLPAGHRLTVSPGAPIAPERYWDLPRVPDRDRIPYDATLRRRFRDLLADAVAIRRRADVPVGATLSGGLDSSAIVLLAEAQRSPCPLHIFTSLYPGTPCDETPYFEAVAERLAEPIIHRVVPDRDEWRETVLAALDHQEEPFGDTSILAHFHLMRAARGAGVPVILSGQGGDELLLGYPSMVNAYLGDLLRRGRVMEGLAEITAWSRSARIQRSAVLRGAAAHAIPLPLRDGLRRVYVSRRAQLVTPALRRAASARRFERQPGRGDLESYLAQVFQRFALPHLTHYDDRNAMAFGVEGRMPFLDHRLVELLFSVDHCALFGHGYTKRILREALGDLLPPPVRARRDKVGFYTPLADVLRAHRSWVESFMGGGRIEDTGFLNPARYRARVDALWMGDDGAALDVWRGFIFHLWLERWDVERQAVQGWAA